MRKLLYMFRMAYLPVEQRFLSLLVNVFFNRIHWLETFTVFVLNLLFV